MTARGVAVLELVDRWRNAGPGGLLYLAKDEREAEYFGANIHSLFPDCPVMVFPRWDCFPYELGGPSSEIMGRRASVLRRLSAAIPEPLLIATPEAALQRVPPRRIWPGATLTVRVGEEISPETLRISWSAQGTSWTRSSTNRVKPRFMARPSMYSRLVR
jgi:transcription-repair coupling factor (superfamily II helicase)